MGNELSKIGKRYPHPYKTLKRAIEEDDVIQRKRQKTEEPPTGFMMKLALSEEGALQNMPTELERSHLLKVAVKSRDPRNKIIIRNGTVSPLLSLPAEIRNEIFQIEMGGQHVHILTDRYPQTLGNLKDAHLPGARLPPTSMNPNTFFNCVYPLEKGPYRKTAPLGQDFPPHSRHWHLQAYEKRVVLASPTHTTLISMVCRQIYHETKLLPYALNRFSFQDRVTLVNWFSRRVPEQKRAIQVVWLDLEWACDILGGWTGNTMFRKHVFGATSGIKEVKVSRLTFRHFAHLNAVSHVDWIGREEERFMAHLYWAMRGPFETEKEVMDRVKIEFLD